MGEAVGVSACITCSLVHNHSPPTHCQLCSLPPKLCSCLSVTVSPASACVAATGLVIASLRGLFADTLSVGLGPRDSDGANGLWWSVPRPSLARNG